MQLRCVTRHLTHCIFLCVPQARGVCVENAVTPPGEESKPPSMLCGEDGQWIGQPTSSCACRPGYEARDSDVHCRGEAFKVFPAAPNTHAHKHTNTHILTRDPIIPHQLQLLSNPHPGSVLLIPQLKIIYEKRVPNTLCC